MKKEEALRNKWYTRLLFATVLAVLLLAPFQGMITMWPTSLVGHQFLWQIVKELILILPFVVVIYLIATRKDIRYAILREKIFILMMVYAVLHVVLFLVNYKDTEAGLAGLLEFEIYAVFPTIFCRRVYIQSQDNIESN
ncbi:MAG: hypothetical protein U0520_04740 [Candidatus Saccharimonadales bacterium]